MGNELMLGGFGQEPERRGRLTREQRELVRRAEHNRDALLFEAKKQEFKAALRKRAADSALYDITDVTHLAQQLAEGNPYLAQQLDGIVKTFTNETARDIRNFGNGTGF
ncbi:hypothetical protein ACWECC_24980 [Streptomyces microflavus]